MNIEPEALRVAQELDDHWLELCPEHYPLERVAACLLREQHAEIERLRSDAERYRFLRELRDNWEVQYDDGFFALALYGEGLDGAVDDAINAAMKEGER